MGAIAGTATSLNWRNTASWVGGVVPSLASNDTVTLADGQIVSTVAGDIDSLGDAANPATPSIQTNTGTGTGRLIVNGTLRVFGDMKQGNSEWQFLGTPIVEGCNTTTPLVWYTSAGGSQPNGKTTITGTDRANRAIVRPGAGSAGFRMTIMSAGSTDYSFATFQGLGSSTAVGLYLGALASGYTISWQNVIVDGCGTVKSGDIGLANNFSWTNVLIKNCTNTTYATDLSFELGTPAAGLRTFTDVHVTKGCMRAVNVAGADFLRCLLVDAWEFSQSWNSFVDCVSCDDVINASFTTYIAGDVTRGMRVRRVASRVNWHGFTVLGTRTIDGTIFDGVMLYDVNEAGDLIMGGLGAGTTVITARNVLATKSANVDGVFGNIVSLLGSATCTVAEMSNCTGWTRDKVSGALLGVSETYMGRADMVQNFKNNLAVGIAAGAGVMVIRDNPGQSNNIKDTVTPANLSNNACYRANTNARDGNGFRDSLAGANAMWTTNPAASLDVDPQFVDDTRNLQTWYRSLVGGTLGTREADTVAAIAALATMNDLSPVAGATIVAAQTWVRGGYKPTNAALQTNVSANNGGWIGAETGTTSTTRARRRTVITNKRTRSAASSSAARFSMGATLNTTPPTVARGVFSFFLN